nr:unnamed protein product [Callosobruchus chinensis]
MFGINRKARCTFSKASVALKFSRINDIMSQAYNQVIPVPALEADLLELLEEKLQPTSVHRGLPRCSTPIRKPKYQPVPTSSFQDDHSWFARELEYTGVAPKLRGSGTRIRGVLSGHLVMYKQD